MSVPEQAGAAEERVDGVPVEDRREGAGQVLDRLGTWLAEARRSYGAFRAPYDDALLDVIAADLEARQDRAERFAELVRGQVHRWVP